MLVIRNFVPSDSESVTGAVRSAWQEYASLIPGWPDLAVRLGALVEKAGQSEVIVAELDGYVVGAVGYVAAASPKPDFFPQDWPIVRLMSVIPAQRGKGIGRQLLEECVARAKRDSAPILALHTTPVMKSAVALYGRNGFVLHQTLPTMYGVPYVLLAKQLELAVTSRCKLIQSSG